MKKAIVLALVIAVVILTFWFPNKFLSPGELIQGHQKLANNCSACHSPFMGINNQKCLTCHSLDEISKDKKATQSPERGMALNFHKKLLTQECSACHSDHKGLLYNSTREGFKHSLLAAQTAENCNECHTKPNNSLHAQLGVNCVACHTTLNWKLSGSFLHSAITGPEKTNCIACHQKPDDAFHLRSIENCSECHTLNKWVPSTFNHNKYFILDGEHAAACKNCHVGADYKTYTCYGCHEHTESNIRSEHQEEGISDYRNCTNCHASGNEHDIKRAASQNREDNNNSTKREHKKEDDD